MSNETRNWLAFDYQSWQLVTSPSACESADDCMRQWWFKKVIRLKEPTKHFTQLGDVFHEVAERWLEADDNGRGVDGKPVDVYPDGWADRLSHGQEAVVKALFQAMVEKGVLRRTPGRQIERSFQIEVLPDRQASMMGFLDVWTPQGIEDHKTSKSRRYLQSRQGLLDNLQMMVYAAAWVDDMIERKQILPDHLELRHNQGVTDPEALFVQPTSVDVSPMKVAEFWETKIVPLVRQMLYWKKAGISPTAWKKVPGPKKKGICRKYGGCAFAGICGRTESVDDYKSRVTLQDKQIEAKTAKDRTMSDDLLAKLAAKKKSRGTAPAPASTPAATVPPGTPIDAVVALVDAATEPISAAAEATTPAPAVVVSATPLATVAPWANADCKACGGSGLNAEGGVCRSCEVTAMSKGIVADNFTLVAVEGAIQILLNEISLALVPYAVPVKVAENTAPIQTTVAPGKTEEPKTEQVEKAAGRGRPKKGFTLIYGIVKRGKGKVIDLQQVLQEYGAALAEEWEGGSYWALETFKRREALAHKAQEIAESFGSATVMISTDQRDLIDFAAALEPFASTVIVAGVR